MGKKYMQRVRVYFLVRDGYTCAKVKQKKLFHLSGVMGAGMWQSRKKCRKAGGGRR